MRALVGHQYRQTPVFSDTISLVVFAPWWGVPRTIAVQDIVPTLAQEGTEYLSRNRIHVPSVMMRVALPTPVTPTSSCAGFATAPLPADVTTSAAIASNRESTILIDLSKRTPPEIS